MSHHETNAAPEPRPSAGPLSDPTIMTHAHTVGPRLPKITDLVIYLSHGSADLDTYKSRERRAAIVTGVHDPSSPWSPLDLCVLNPSGIFFAHACPSGDAPGHWMWP